MVNQRARAFVRQSSFLLRSQSHRFRSAALWHSGKVLDAFSALLFPRVCPGCMQALPFPETVCDPCAAGLKRILDPFCRRCGAPMPEHWKVEQCPECRAARSPVTRTRSVYSYDGLVRQMIREVKYRRRPRYLRFFAGTLYPMICAEFPRSIEALVPVPLHVDREWDRRFNQAELLCRNVSRLSGIPVANALHKHTKTTPQSSLSGVARRKNLRNAFECRFPGDAPGTVLLMDDVVTTGTTLTRCAAALRRAGVRRVYAATIARAVKRRV